MRTDNDLHGAFALLERHADEYGVPDFAVEPAGPERPARTRQWWTRTALAITATAAVVAGGIYAATTMGSKSDETRPGGPPPVIGPVPSPVKLQFTFSVGPVAGATVSYRGVYRGEQTADVWWAAGDGSGASLHVYAPGRYDPKSVEAQGTKVAVGTHLGYFSTPLDTSVAPNDGLRAPILAWQYGHDAWATVQFQGTGTAAAQLEDKAITLAEAVHTGVTSVLRLPFKIGYLPPNLVPSVAFVLQSNPGSGRLGLSDGVRPDDASMGGLWIQAIENVAHNRTPCSKRVSVQGTTACFRNLHEYATEPGSKVVGRELSFETPARMVTITIDRAHLSMYSDDDLVQIAQSLTFAGSMADYNTWFDARTVLPH